MNTEYYDCVCKSADHTIRFVYFEEDKGEDAEIYLEVQLAHAKKWYQRVWKALKYIFGYECRYGHWDVWLLDPKDVDRLISMLDAHRTRLNTPQANLTSNDKSSDVKCGKTLLSEYFKEGPTNAV
jgi:hypothetical protein